MSSFYSKISGFHNSLLSTSFLVKFVNRGEGGQRRSLTATAGLSYGVPPGRDNCLHFLRRMFEHNRAARFLALCWTVQLSGQVQYLQEEARSWEMRVHQVARSSESSGELPKVYLWQTVLNSCWPSAFASRSCAGSGVALLALGQVLLSLLTLLRQHRLGLRCSPHQQF